MRDVFTQKRCRFQGLGKKSLIKGSRTQGLRKTSVDGFQDGARGRTNAEERGLEQEPSRTLPRDRKGQRRRWELPLPTDASHLQSLRSSRL